MESKIAHTDTIPLRVVAATKAVFVWISNTAIPTYRAYQLIILRSIYMSCNLYIALVVVSTLLSLVVPPSWLSSLPRIFSIKLIIISYYAGKYFRRRYDHELLIQTHSCKPIGLVHRGLWSLITFIQMGTKAAGDNSEYIFRQKSHDTIGETYIVPIVMTNVVFTRSTKIVKEVLQNDMSRWDLGGYILRSKVMMFGGTSLFVQTGRDWKSERFGFGSLLVRNDEEDSACAARHARNLVRLLIKQGPRHDIKDVIGHMVTNIAMEIL